MGVEEEGLAMAGVLNLCLGSSNRARTEVLKGLKDDSRPSLSLYEASP